jgi:hypothetical protein
MDDKELIFPSRTAFYFPFVLLIIAAVCLGDDHSAATSRLLAGFRNPPKEARPSTYWLWLNGYVDRDHAAKELKAFHAAGIRGVCIFDMGARGAREASPPAGPPFLSKTSVAEIAHAVRIAQQLDMDVQLSVASSWDMGGTWVPPRHASMGLFTSEISVVGPADFHRILPLPPVPTKAPRRPDGQLVYQKDIAVLAFPDNIHDGATSDPGGSSSSAEPPPVCIEKRESILNLTDRLDGEGRLQWRVPEGRWTIMRCVCLNTGERLKVPSPNSDGLATDHLSHAATRAFLDHLISQLQAQLGDLSQTALKQLYLASYEVRGPIWTPDLLEQFHRYRGYDMTPYLPVLSGKRVVSEEISQRFMYDYRKTLGDLLVDAYYRTAVDVAHAAGIGIESEAGGPGPPIHQVPVDALKAQGAIDELRGEFWPKRPQADRLWVVKETACAAHIYGKRRVHMEAFTSMHHWQDGPYDLKPSADRVFCEGANHFVWHTASHLPRAAGQPGWVYHAGTHLNTNLIWWPKAKPFLDYLSRCSFLLQQGLFVADVCYYYGDQGYNFVPPKHVDPSLGFGFDYDVTNREVILNRMSVRDGRITLPDGMSYALLVLPERPDIDLDVLKKIEHLVREGASVVGPKPTRTNGLTDYPQRDAQVRKLADRLWGPCDGKTIFQHTLGRGRILWGRPLREILSQRGIGPDLSFTSKQKETQIDFVHRRTEDSDIYFIRNTKPRPEQVEVTFRVQDRSPERWDPDTGHAQQQAIFQTSPKGTTVTLQFAPYGSLFVLFRKAQGPLPCLTLDQGNRPVDLGAARVDAWDGRRARLTVSQPGPYRISTDDGRSVDLNIGPIPKPIELKGPWQVQFSPALGAPLSLTFDNLSSWTDHPNRDIRYFSGTAQYQRVVELPEDWLTEDRRVLLDLGNLWAVGEVFLNGQSLGVLWKPPYVIDITSAATPGPNKLLIEVANTWSNRLAGDAQLPPGEGLTRTNIQRSGGRSWKDMPLHKSGLFGPVRLLPTKVVNVDLP